MKVTMQSTFSGIVRTLDLPVTQEQLDNWRSGVLIQNTMPNLTADQREFLMTGITDWDNLSKEE